MADGPHQKALRASLKGWTPAVRDQAAIALAQRYAALLDAPAHPSSYSRALDRLERLAVDPFDRQAFERLRDALAAHTVASDLGPKFLAVLDRLGMTPAARGVKAATLVSPGETAPEPEPEPRGTRDDLKARRAARRAGGAG